MAIIQNLFRKSPFGPIVLHAKKVHECVEMIKPLMEALAYENYPLLRELRDKVSSIEHEADKIKHDIHENLTRRYFLPVDRQELDGFLECQEKMADYAEDFAVILMIRKTRLHPDIQDKFFALVDQMFQVSGTLLTAAVELKNLAEVSFGGAEAKQVLDLIKDLGKEEWKADRLASDLSIDIFQLEGKVSVLDILFYEKMLLKIGSIANEAENAGDFLRAMIAK
ncbi:MAG: TIGR00153 family protein [Desulfobulbaceae bacterium DB1]|nr:MAG: TIGR00153 family protein [Desulfobulbaceae bacterium DB1]